MGNLALVGGERVARLWCVCDSWRERQASGRVKGAGCVKTVCLNVKGEDRVKEKDIVGRDRQTDRWRSRRDME